MTNIEAAFRTLKSDLGLRPVYHRLEQRIEAHILVAFLAYCPQVTLKNSLRRHAPGLTPTQVLDQLATVQMIDARIPTLDGRWLTMPRYTQPSKELRFLMEKLHLAFPVQPPPRIGQYALPAPTPSSPSPLRLWGRPSSSPNPVSMGYALFGLSTVESRCDAVV